MVRSANRSCGVAAPASAAAAAPRTRAEQLAEREGLGDEVGAEVEGAHLVALAAAHREHDDRRRSRRHAPREIRPQSRPPLGMARSVSTSSGCTERQS
jgi:hypothetical protein